MTAALSNARLLAIARELERRKALDPLSSMSWLPMQLEYLTCTDKLKLARSGVQQGKTRVGAADTVLFAIGQSRYRSMPTRATLQWVVGGTDQQLQNPEKHVYDFARPYLHPESPYWDDSKGKLSGKYPRLLFKNGSEIQFRTGGGDLHNLSSNTVDRVWIDEPPDSERAFNALLERISRTNGEIGMTLTPQNRPTGWLRQRCEDKQVRDLHYNLSIPNLTFADGPQAGRLITLTDGTPCDENWIAYKRKITSPYEAPVSLDGEWEYRIEDAFLSKVWDHASQVRATPPAGEVDALIGIDLGDRPGKLIAVLIYVTKEGLVHVADECVDWEASWTIERFAKELLIMLKRNNWTWGEVHRAYSDRDHKAGKSDFRGMGQIQQAIAKDLGIKYEQVMPPIRGAKRGAGKGGQSVITRSEWLHELMALRRFSVHPRCKRLIEAIPRYNPRVDNDAKDPLDALLYGATDLIYSPFRKATGSFRLPW